MEINLELESFNKIYNVGEFVTGNIIISNNEKTLDFECINISLVVIKKYLIKYKRDPTQ